MGRRESFGDRERMERLLEVEELRALLEAARWLGVRRYAWHLEPSLARFAELVTFARKVAELEEGGASATAAEVAAAAYLGLSVDTLRARRRRAAGECALGT